MPNHAFKVRSNFERFNRDHRDTADGFIFLTCCCNLYFQARDTEAIIRSFLSSYLIMGEFKDLSSLQPSRAEAAGCKRREAV